MGLMPQRFIVGHFSEALLNSTNVEDSRTLYQFFMQLSVLPEEFRA
jgi:hypothetical protein